MAELLYLDAAMVYMALMFVQLRLINVESFIEIGVFPTLSHAET